jgi:hypothetical protein
MSSKKKADREKKKGMENKETIDQLGYHIVIISII